MDLGPVNVGNAITSNRLYGVRHALVPSKICVSTAPEQLVFPLNPVYLSKRCIALAAPQPK
jgi:hypothetical protein